MAKVVPSKLIADQIFKTRYFAACATSLSFKFQCFHLSFTYLSPILYLSFTYLSRLSSSFLHMETLCEVVEDWILQLLRRPLSWLQCSGRSTWCFSQHLQVLKSWSGQFSSQISPPNMPRLCFSQLREHLKLIHRLHSIFTPVRIKIANIDGSGAHAAL